jgi:hypothetical protein
VGSRAGMWAKWRIPPKGPVGTNTPPIRLFTVMQSYISCRTGTLTILKVVQAALAIQRFVLSQISPRKVIIFYLYTTPHQIFSIWIPIHHDNVLNWSRDQVSTKVPRADHLTDSPLTGRSSPSTLGTRCLVLVSERGSRSPTRFEKQSKLRCKPVIATSTRE